MSSRSECKMGNKNPMYGKISRRLNLLGKRFGRLTVIGFVGLADTKQRVSMWLCKCDCGNEKIIRGAHLTSCATKSCNCLSIERATTHGLSKTKAYGLDKCRKRQIAKLNQSTELTEIEKKKLLLYYKISEYLGEGWHVDHIQPINKGGAHHPDNLQVLSSELNLKKRDKYPLTPEEEIEYRGIRI